MYAPWGIAIHLQLATTIVQRWINPALRVTAERKLHGGMVHRVCRWTTDGQPAEMVAKLNAYDHASSFERELAASRWLREHSRFPVPEPFACVQHAELNLSGLLMAWVPGTTLAEARMSPQGVRHFQYELAHHIGELHTHTRETYGHVANGPGNKRWLDSFAPALDREFRQVRDGLSSRSREIIENLLTRLDNWLPESSQPTLVHGDLWATNILVDDALPNRPRIVAFVDCDASYCDPEYELAYLRLFRTVDQVFFELYGRQHPLRPGFDRRCRVYWLNTMLLHVRLFGDRYLRVCEDLAGQIAQLDR